MNRIAFISLFVLAGTTLRPGLAATVPDHLVESYAAARQNQSARLRGASMDVEISASVPNLHKDGKLRALKRISQLGRTTYQVLRFDGDSSVKKDVIARYLAADAEAAATSDALAVLPSNYNFKYKGRMDQETGSVYVFAVTPKKKRVGLFRGELWLDAQSFLPVMESGRFVKSPSVFVKRIDFVREYQIRGGLSIPVRMHSTVDTRLVGKTELTVNFLNVALADEPLVPASYGGGE